LAAWRAYWDAKPYEFVSVAPRDGDVFLTGRFVERPDSGLEWAEGISTQWVDGYLVHRPGEREVHYWGYDQVTALVAASRYFDEPAYLHAAEATAQRLFRRQALEGPYRSYPGRNQESLCAYDVAACCRGLGALYAVTKKGGVCRLVGAPLCLV